MVTKMANMQYKHTSGLTAEVTGGSVFCSFLFGWMYYLVKGVYKHAVLAFILAFATVGISLFVYPFFTRRIMHEYYLKTGYEVVT